MAALYKSLIKNIIKVHTYIYEGQMCKSPFFEKQRFERNWNFVETNFYGQSRLSDDRLPILLEQKVSKHKLDLGSTSDFHFSAQS